MLLCLIMISVSSKMWLHTKKNVDLILTEFLHDAQWKMVLVGHSHWIQLKAFSFSSHANKCIIYRTLKKAPIFPATTTQGHWYICSVGDVSQMPYALPCIHYVLFELQAVFFLSPTFEWSLFNVQMNGGESDASVTFTMRLHYDFLKS